MYKNMANIQRKKFISKYIITTMEICLNQLQIINEHLKILVKICIC